MQTNHIIIKEGEITEAENKKKRKKKNQQQSLKGASENKWTSAIRKIDKRYLWRS